MRIWKRLLGTALCLCAAVCVMSVSASAEGGHSRHPICGAAHENIGDHTGTCNDVTWTAWDGMGEITYTDNTACVYLSDIATRNGALKVSNGQTLNLCLNGKTLKSAGTVIEVKGNATLNICDCQGNGGITISSGCVIEVDTRDYVNRNAVLGTATLNLYGGKISGSVKSDGYMGYAGVIMLYNNKSSDKAIAAVFNMYGGEVRNRYDSSNCCAVYANNAKTGKGYYNINIYGGDVACEKGKALDLDSKENVALNIAGGTITGGEYGVKLNSGNELTLSGGAAIVGTDAGIYIPNNVTLTIKNDFTPAGGTKISVEKSVDSSVSVLIAKPAAGASSLSDKAQYFVSAEEGYFVESNDDGDLQLTACAITEQPAVNDYTVTANGGDKATYQWYSAKQGDVPVTNAVVKSEGDLSYWNGEWSTSSIPQSGEVTGFTLTMKKGDELTLDCSDSYGVHIGSVTLSDGTNTDTAAEGLQTYTLTAPADGDYTLKISCTAVGGYARLQFTAKVTADVPDMTNPLSGQTAAKLNTTGLPSGSYICQVTWENKTTLNSQAVRCAAAPSHAHSWSSEWKSNDTHHWHECENGCTEKSSYAEHAGGTATCQAKAVCVTCGTAYGDLDPNGHDWGAWAVTTPATTSAAGVETRVCKRDGSHTETRAIPKLTPAPSGGGSSGGSSSTPAVTVPVSGSGDTVHVSASVSGSTAEVKEIKSAELDKIGTDSAVVIDLSSLNKGVTGVTLSTDTIDSICKTEADGVTIKLPGAELRVDRQTLAAVTEQAAGSKIRLVVEPDGTARSTMTAAQKSVLDGMRNAAVLEAYFVSDGTRIRDFNGGEVELSIPYQASGALRAWFLKEDGTREPVSARYDKENARLLLHHFSHYVIEELDSSAAYTVCAKDDSCPLEAFGDLTATSWYHDGVHYCLENGLMRGVSGGKFLPDGSTTRAQLVTILWRLEGSPETTGAVRFGDTAGGAWYTEAVRWAAGCGVVKGYDGGRFGPNDAVTREQLVTILYRYAQHKGYDVSAGEDTNILSFDDAFAVSEYAIPAMQWACGSGMVRGIAQKGGMLLAPGDTTTRAQTATLLTRFQSAFAKEP